MSAITEIQRVSLEFSEEITFNVGSFLQDIKNKIENINIYKVYFFKTNTPPLNLLPYYIITSKIGNY